MKTRQGKVLKSRYPKELFTLDVFPKNKQNKLRQTKKDEIKEESYLKILFQFLEISGNWKPFKNDEKRILFHLKSYFCFVQLIEYNIRNIFLENSYRKCDGETIPRVFSKKSKLYAK